MLDSRKVAWAGLTLLGLAAALWTWRTPTSAAPNLRDLEARTLQSNPTDDAFALGGQATREMLVTPEPAALVLGTREDASAGISAATLLHGRVVDDTTGDAVADLVVTTGKGERKLEATTDAAGRFQFDLEPSRHVFGAYLASGAKVTVSKSNRRVAVEDLPIELRVKIGPRYLVQIVGPPEAQEATWTAHLIVRVPTRNGPPREQDRAVPQPLSDGDPRSVRFPKRPQAQDDETLQLVLHDDSGEWRGEIEAPTLVGEHDQVLQIVVARLGVLLGRVAEDTGDPILGATVHLTPAGDASWPPIGGPWEQTRTDANGAFLFADLAPAEYFLRIAPPWRPMIQRRVLVPEGTYDLGTTRVPGGGPHGTVSGVLRSVAGRGALCAILQLESLDGTGWARSTIVGRPTALMLLFYGGRAAQEAGEESEVPFRLDDVPAGRYRLVVVPWDARRYEPTVLELTAPTDAVVIFREDTTPDVGFAFEVTDADSGERLETFMARFHTRRWGKELSYPQRSGEVLGRLAVDGDLSWAIFAAGYIPVWGDATAFVGTGDPRVHHVALERGWGADLVVRDGRDPRRHHDRAASKLSIPAPGEVPLPGVRVLADGEPVGITDAGGRLRVVLAAQPARLDFELGGWRTTPTTTFAGGRVLHSCPSPKVWMVPVE